MISLRRVAEYTNSHCDPVQFHIPFYTGFPPLRTYSLHRRRTAIRMREKIGGKRWTNEEQEMWRRKKEGGGLFTLLKPSAYYMYNLFEHTKSLHSAHTVYLFVPYGSHNKQRLFPQTALTGSALYWRRNVFPVRYKLCILPTQCICVFRMVLTINSDSFPKQR
jgi:hypothetical protein